MRDPLDNLKFHGSLHSLINILQERVQRASDLILKSEDSGIIDREIRYIRPFWEFLAEHQVLTQQQYWETWSGKLTGESLHDFVRVTPLVWIPRRQRLCRFIAAGDGQTDQHVIPMLCRLDTVVFNFVTLMARCHYLLGIENPESFQVDAQNEAGTETYQLSLQAGQDLTESGTLNQTITARFRLPDAEEIVIIRDYSRDFTDPTIQIWFQVEESQQTMDDRLLEYCGLQSELKNSQGQLVLH